MDLVTDRKLSTIKANIVISENCTRRILPTIGDLSVTNKETILDRARDLLSAVTDHAALGIEKYWDKKASLVEIRSKILANPFSLLFEKNRSYLKNIDSELDQIDSVILRAETKNFPDLDAILANAEKRTKELIAKLENSHANKTQKNSKPR